MLPSNKSYMDFIKAGKKAKHGIFIGEIQDSPGMDEAIYLAALLKNEDWILVFQQENFHPDFFFSPHTSNQPIQIIQAHTFQERRV